ncbi:MULTISPECIES: hypothetical protein [unclassified Rhodococcus (in: high G+C Gram-positive bacteria)]|uniref:hypothetical protein n=1 Tax=unclassified Rhodococcus (in: high G+C Gram-positive bacteria) TaxID=192944 RepID=UPI001C9A9B88|nr:MULTISPECIES: hypothetical protein [unclassified Rhodococcus (in: high G+C Gram-positive bacteria)]MBY6702221.1 hypothetical protein [Rhodococcus sp. BP-283]
MLSVVVATAAYGALTLEVLGPLAAWVGAILTAGAVVVALTTNRRDRAFTANQQTARAVADLWSTIVAVRRPLAAFDAVAREPNSFVNGVPSRELDRLSGDVQDALTAAEASSFYARLVIDSGRLLDHIDDIATELSEMRAFFEEGGEHQRDGSRPPGYEQPVFSVVDWLDGLGLRLRRILTVEQTLMDAVRFHFPVTDSQRAVADSTDSQQLWQDAYIRAKAFPHTEIYRRHADPPGSWRTRWR